MDDVNEFLWLIIQTILFVGLLAAAVLGLWSLLAPNSFLKLEKHLSRSAPIDFSVLDKPYDMDRLVYRYHVPAGILISLFSMLILLFLAFHLDRQTFLLQAWFGHGFWSRFIADSMLGLVYFTVILSLYFGGIVLVRPSALRRIEYWANRYFSPGGVVRNVNRPSLHTNDWVEKNPRIFGGTVLILVILILFGMNFFKLA